MCIRDSLVAKELKVSEHHVEAGESAAVAEVYVAVNGRAADVHAHLAFMNGRENFFLARIAVE